MTPNSLSPSSAVIDYHSVYGAHKQTIPTSQWFPIGATGDLGGYVDHDGDAVDAEEMWVAYFALAKAFLPTTAMFDGVTIYTQAAATGPNIPRVSKAISVAGTSPLSGLSQAQSTTLNFKTAAHGDFKLVFLDTQLGSNGFNALHPADFTTPVTNLANFITGRDTAITGRDDSIPNTLRKITYDLNDKLQKVYRMGD